MNKLSCILMLVICLCVFFVWKKSKTKLNNVLPSKPVFLIDEGFSQSFQKNMSDSITAQYDMSKDPAIVIQKVSQAFPEVSCIKAHICKADKMCFSLQGAKPVCLINGDLVVCDNTAVVAKDHFNVDRLNNLPQIKLPSNYIEQEGNIDTLLEFFKQLPVAFGQLFTFDWKDDSEIILQPISATDSLYLISVYQVPTQQDIALCQKIKDAAVSNRPQKNKKRIVTYDLRFKNQIIVR